MIIEKISGAFVLRDDRYEGGSKARFLPYLMEGKAEVVYGSPVFGGAALAMSYVGKKMNIPVTIFYAKRKELHWMQKIVRNNGARIIEVPLGFMSNVQAKARAYCEKTGAWMFPLGFDLPEAREPFLSFIRSVKAALPSIDEVCCAAGSGMLSRCLAEVFSESQISAVAVGLKSRYEKQKFPPNLQLIPCPYRFEQECRIRPPFKSSANYDAKAWEYLMRKYRGEIPQDHKVLFWNVL